MHMRYLDYNIVRLEEKMCENHVVLNKTESRYSL